MSAEKYAGVKRVGCNAGLGFGGDMNIMQAPNVGVGGSLHGHRNIEIVGESNGHQWFLNDIAGKKMECCLDCGIIRRRDDKNKQCRGKVTVAIR